MKKEVRFSAKLDSEEFVRAVEAMKRKLNDATMPQDVAGMAGRTGTRLEQQGVTGLSKPSQEAYNRAAMQSRRELDQFLQKEVQAQNILGKHIEKRITLMDGLKKQQENLTRGAADELAIREKIARLEDSNRRSADNYRARDQAINGAMDMKQNGSPAQQIMNGFTGGTGGPGGMRGAMGAVPGAWRSMDMAGKFNVGAQVVGGIARFAGGAADVYSNYQKMGTQQAQMYGSASRNLDADNVNSAYNGRSAIEMAWMPEKMRAMRDASNAMHGQRVSNNTNLATDAIGTTAGYTAAGAGMGAAAGAVIFGGLGAGIGGLAGGVGAAPGAYMGATGGAAFGAKAGGLLGAGYGMFKAGSNIAQDGTKSALVGSMLPGAIGNNYNKQYEGKMLEQFGDNYKSSLEGYKAQDPYKNAALENYNSNYGRHLDFQRSVGMGFHQFHDPNFGFQRKAVDNGFTDDMAMQSSSAILGAGGSTRMARDTDNLGLKAARGFNLTNASQNLGTISGAMGDSESSKAAYIKMIEAGTRAGLDSSTYAEENRKYMDAQAEVASRTGSTSGNDMDRILGSLSGFLANKTGKGIDAAKGAFDWYNNQNSATDGPGGVQRASGFMKNKFFNSMSAPDRAILANINQGDYNEQDPRLQSIFNKYKGKDGAPSDVQGMIKQMTDNNDTSTFNTSRGDSKRDAARALFKKMSSIDRSTEAGQKQYDALNAQYQDSLGTVAGELTLQNKSQFGGNGGGVRAMSAAKGIVEQGNAAAFDGADDINKTLNNKKTDKVEDESVAGAAENSRAVLKNFIDFKDQLIPAATAIKKFHEQIALLVLATESMDPAKRAKYRANLADAEGFARPTNAETAGKVSK